MDILFLIGGLLLILLGANGLTDGAASIAKRFHIPSIVIGLTIVAFGTSAPELTVSVSSALKGSTDIAIGNVVGSNIFNTLMIVGCTALFAPIVISQNTLRKEIPLCILSSIVLLICANDVLLIIVQKIFSALRMACYCSASLSSFGIYLCNRLSGKERRRSTRRRNQATSHVAVYPIYDRWTGRAYHRR